MMKIKVLLKEPMKDFEELEIEDSFPIIKDIVGGPTKTIAMIVAGKIFIKKK